MAQSGQGPARPFIYNGFTLFLKGSSQVNFLQVDDGQKLEELSSAFQQKLYIALNGPLRGPSGKSSEREKRRAMEKASSFSENT